MVYACVMYTLAQILAARGYHRPFLGTSPMRNNHTQGLGDERTSAYAFLYISENPRCFMSRYTHCKETACPTSAQYSFVTNQFTLLGSLSEILCITVQLVLRRSACTSHLMSNFCMGIYETAKSQSLESENSHEAPHKCKAHRWFIFGLPSAPVPPRPLAPSNAH